MCQLGKLTLLLQLDHLFAITPDNISKKLDLTPMPLAMGAAPECMNPDDVIGSYRKFYMTKQHRFSMTWKNRTTPEWFEYV